VQIEPGHLPAPRPGHLPHGLEQGAAEGGTADEEVHRFDRTVQQVGDHGESAHDE